MVDIKIDTHVHTVHSTHAFSTLKEDIYMAEMSNLDGIVITDHFGPYFSEGNLFQSYAGITNIRNVSKDISNMKVFSGVEIDIVDKYGHLAYFDTYFNFNKNRTVLDLLTSKCEVVIASYHFFDDWNLSSDQCTNMLVNVLENSRVHILGHCDRIPYKFNLDEVIKTAQKSNKAIELNCGSIDKNLNTKDFIKVLLKKCKKENVYISIGSDAHYCSQVGNFGKIKKILLDEDFPEELIINKSLESFNQFIELHSRS